MSDAKVNQPSPPRRRAAPLPTRHVFLDTEVYRRFSLNAQHPLLQQLGEAAIKHRVVWHITDITLQELERHILRNTNEHTDTIRSLEKKALRSWRKRIPESLKLLPPPIEIEPEIISKELFRLFNRKITSYGVVEHNALSIPASIIFSRYFSELPPFERGAKEFPDAFVLQALCEWCEQNSEKMIVVTNDKAMSKAASNMHRLIPMSSVDDVLAGAGAEFGGDWENVVDALLHGQNFDGSLVQQLESEVSTAPFVYTGLDLAEGEALEGELNSIHEINGWSLIHGDEGTVVIILYCELDVSVTISYENRTDAIYDREDDIWYGAENSTTEIQSDIGVDILVEINRKKSTVRRARILNREISVDGDENLYD
ncbi:MAG: PIN domain-containing protein [Devosia sp.]